MDQDIWGGGNDQGSSISADEYGYQYASFTFTDSIDIAGYHLISHGAEDIAMMKFTSDGTVIWVKSYGTGYRDLIGKIIAKHNKVYTCGVFSNAGTETLMIDSVSIVSHGYNDLFLLQLDTAGIALWGKSIGTPLSDNGGGIAVDRQGNVFISGNTGGNLMLENDTLWNVNFASTYFLIKYDNVGEELWAKAAFSDGVYYGGDIEIDTNGNVYQTSYTIDDNIINFGSINLNNYYYNKAYLAKYSPNGQLLFAKKISTYTFYDALNSIKLNPIDNTIYLCGSYNYLATFGTDTLHSYGHDDILLLKMNEQGNIIWCTHAGGSLADGAIGMAVAPNGDLVLTGYTSSSNCNFGNIQVSAQNGWDIFVARLSQTSDVADNDKESKEIKVFPNPAENTVFVHADDALERIVVYDITGRHVLDWQPDSVPKNKVCLNIEGLVNGLYFITTTIKDLQSKPKQLLVHH